MTCFFQDAREAPSPFLEALESLGWIDLTAIAVLLVFFVLGLFRGAIWQLGRIASLALAYVAAGAWGDALAPQLRGLFSEGAHELLPLYTAWVIIFLAVLVLVSVVTWLVQKLVDRTGLSFFDRVGGGLLGVGTGALVVLAALTAVFMFDRTLGVGGGIVEAAERSHSLTASHRVLRAAQGVLPQSWSEIPEEWRVLLRDQQAESEAAGPREATFPPPQDGRE